MLAAADQAFLSRADCKCTQIGSGADYYCRANGGVYHLSRVADKKVEVCRGQATRDAVGWRIGAYQGPPHATKAVGQVADQPGPRR
jgi:hypothetical protein